MPSFASHPIHTSKMPPGIPYIIGNEAAERFSFYGMRTILTIFMVNYLWLMGDSPTAKLSDAEATKHFHDFVSLVYLTPIFGALLADLFFGKYRIIMVLSVVYCLGHAVLALMGIVGDAQWWLIAGLWLISIGSGGIKPCVSAHVGDQFGSENRHFLPRIFNWFYWSINLGAFLSTLLTPWLLEWHGPHWAFGVPGILMALATLVFWMGRWKFVHIPAKGTGFLKELFSAVGLKAMAKLFAIYLFVAIFWALYDQTGSSWVLQAENMDRNWLGIEWLPSQIQALNPILILTFIPLFSYVIYPLIDRIFPLTPLRKISIGLFLTAASFALVSMAQGRIDAGGTPSISWQLLSYVLLTAGEVMVSIVCLEFSYTQAPRSMKSVIMAIFLISVSLGNQFTSAINHFIQVEKPLDQIESISNEVTHGGFDQQSGTKDDFKLTFDNEGRQTALTFAGKAKLDQLLDLMVSEIEIIDYEALSTERGKALAASVNDPWGAPFQFHLINRNEMRIWSNGADGTPLTPWDQGAVLSITRPDSNEASAFAAFFDQFRPEEPWLERRKTELGVETKAQARAAGPSVSRDYFVGGLLKLEGASYFWFFTFVMLGAAAIFVIVAKLYQPKEYFHDEADIAEAREEAIGN
ncbi:MAG: POT family MFS transporter [Verrucomicrobiales bacterium]|nr:POT family MFS transporter [Verrucomicrobiales bacterium]